jgi:NAD(P)H-hydrate repair Nnr-like enzyme with NAD(P)H-hydrate dehydratase domain
VPVFDYLTQHPDEAKLIGEALIGIHGDEPSAIAAAYDFANIQTLMDVGGTGNLLATILRAYLARFGTSRTIHRKAYTTARLAAAIQRLLNDFRYRERATTIARQI